MVQEINTGGRWRCGSSGQGGHSGRMADEIWRPGQSGHKADTWRTSSGDVASISWLFFPKREPHRIKAIGPKKLLQRWF